jgi:hypothetical protein
MMSEGGQAKKGAVDVCHACVDEDDLTDLIRGYDVGRCDFCGRTDLPVMPLDDLGPIVRERITEFYYLAEEAPVVYSSADGGYRAPTEDTDEVIVESHPIDLPNDDDGALRRALVDAVGDDLWIDRDFSSGRFADGELLRWSAFVRTVKYQRRFFFHSLNQGGVFELFDASFAALLKELAELCRVANLVDAVRSGLTLYRSRPRKADETFTTAGELGPPPAALTRQPNRMNPPGIPMFYGAESRELAIAEAHEPRLSVGRFVAEKPLVLLDLASELRRPGFYSDARRHEANAMDFLRQFAKLISAAVTRDEGAHIEYVPTQVFTEYLRDYPFFDGHPLDGIRYRSATGTAGTNVVLFATQNDVVDAGVDLDVGDPDEQHARWLRLERVEQVSRTRCRDPGPSRSTAQTTRRVPSCSATKAASSRFDPPAKSRSPRHCA